MSTISVNPQKVVKGERHVLGKKVDSLFVVIPLEGTFCNNEQLKISIAGKELSPEQFEVLSVFPDTFEKYTKQICEVILIKDSIGFVEADVASLDYQISDQKAYFSHEGTFEVLQNSLTKTGPIDFKKHVFNKPDSYNPSFHTHFAKDTVGYGDLIVGFERLISALTLQNIPAFEALIDWVKANKLEIADSNDIKQLTNLNRGLTLQGLLTASKHMSFSTLFVETQVPVITAGEAIRAVVRTTSIEPQGRLYWKIVHKETFPMMFDTEQGEFILDDQVMRLMIGSKQLPDIVGTFGFYISIHKGSPTGPMVAKSETMSLCYPNNNANPAGVHF